MSGSVVTVGGGFGGQSGVLSVQSSLPASINSMLQQYLSGLPTTSGAGDLISDTTGGSSVSVSAGVQAVVVDAPNNLTVAGSSSTTLAEFGATSNVDYSVTNGQGSIFASGGANMINVYSTSQPSNLDIISAGNDTVNLMGIGSDSVNADGNATTTVFVGAGTAAVTASGSSTATIIFTQNAGGNLDFVNNSSAAQTVFSGSYTTAGGQNVFAPNSVTAFGGAGGGFYVGGRAGNNSLVGGSGAVTLQGGGNGDYLEGTGASTNMFAGSGLETLIGTSTSGGNTFQLGLLNVGVGDVTSSGVVSTEGSGLQSFIIGNVQGETLTGSSAVGATNLYTLVGDSTTGGSNFTITDFTSNSVIFLENNSLNGAGDATISAIVADPFNSNNSIIGLSDGTHITLVGVSASQVYTATGANSIIGIGHT